MISLGGYPWILATILVVHAMLWVLHADVCIQPLGRVHPTFVCTQALLVAEIPTDPVWVAEFVEQQAAAFAQEQAADAQQDLVFTSVKALADAAVGMGAVVMNLPHLMLLILPHLMLLILHAHNAPCVHTNPPPLQSTPPPPPPSYTAAAMAYPSADNLSLIDGMLQVVLDACEDEDYYKEDHKKEDYNSTQQRVRDAMHCVAAARALADAGAAQASIAAVAHAAGDQEHALLLVRSALGHAVRAGLRDGQWRALAAALDDAVVHGMRGDEALRYALCGEWGVMIVCSSNAVE